MNNVFSLLFSEPFIFRALIIGILISLCCALLGVSLVLKRYSMIGDGLSHVGFGALAIACCVNIAPLYFSLPIVIVAAFLLIRMNENSKIKGDSAIALLSTGALAVGVMVMSMSKGMNVDVYNYMFGSILTMTDADVALSVVLCALVIIMFIVFYNEIFSVTFDESFAKATGTKTGVYNSIIAVLTAVTIVIGMRIIGTLLISSLIIFPSVISMRICKSYKTVVISSSVLSVLSFFIGMLVSLKLEAPTGASVVCVNIIFLLIFTVIGKVLSSKAGGFVSKFRLLISYLILIISLVAFSLFIFLGNDIKTVENKEISVVATNFASYDFTREICSDKVELTMLLKPGEESHTYEPSAADIKKIQNCDLFIYTGGESDSWIDEMLLSTDNLNAKMIKMMEITGAEKETISEGMQGEYEDEYDEHVWTSPKNALKITRQICETVSTIDIENAIFYKSNFQKFEEKINSLDESFNELSKKADGKYFVIGDRFPFKYLFDEYSLNYYAAFPGCSAETQANPVTLSFLNAKVKEQSISAVFKVDMSNGNVASMTSKTTGADVFTLYSCQGISLELFERGETYISLMQSNLENLKQALN